MMRDDFAVFILTHGRADNVITYNTLRQQGYTGKIFLIVDDHDSQVDDYRDRYGEEVVVFSKDEAIASTDSMNNFGQYGCIVYARNQSFKIAKDLGLTYFLQLDDDYGHFWYTIDNDGKYLTGHKKIKNLDVTFEMVLNFLIDSEVTTVCIAQGGDFVGGPGSLMAQKGAKGEWSRKGMNSFFFRTDRPLEFRGVNEDVNAYTALGNTGTIILTIPRLRLEQKPSQTSGGGMTEGYLGSGTYIKSFYSVMAMPSSVSVALMGVSDYRLHHRVSWKHTVPHIISEEHRKRPTPSTQN